MDIRTMSKRRGISKYEAKGKQGVGWQKEMLPYKPAYVHSVTYTLSANNDALCLGYK
jgi:hypothetical protein